MPLKKSCGRVLTSIENVKAMEEKELVKKEKVKQKEECKLRMEKRKLERAQLAAEKKNAKKTGRQQNKRNANGPNFTVEEIKVFKRRLENGYIIKTDKRYKMWLKTFCVQSKCTTNTDLIQESGDSLLYVADHSHPQRHSPQGILSPCGNFEEDHCTYAPLGWTPASLLFSDEDCYCQTGE